MIFDTLTLFALAFAVLVSPVSGNPSAVPHNGYTCPPTGQRKLCRRRYQLCIGPHSLRVSHHPGQLRYYLQLPVQCGKSPTFYLLFYQCSRALFLQATGALITDSDDANCPETGVTPVQRRSSRVARAPLPSRPLVNRGVPAGPADKAYLKKRRS